MKCLLGVVAICAIVVPAFASPDGLPVMKVKGYTTVGFNAVTGAVYPLPIQERFGRPMWYNLESGYFFAQWNSTPGQELDATVLDWGDLGTPGTGFSVGGFYFFVLGSQTPATPGLDVAITWIAEENGYNTVTRIPWARLTLINLPGLPYAPPGWGSGWQFAVDLQTFGWTWTLDGNDLDADGLVDFGYSYCWFNVPVPQTTVLGTTIGPPHPGPGAPEGTGAEDAFDMFADCDYQTYYGTYWFGGIPYAQFCARFHDTDCATAGITPPGVLDFCWTDIYPAGADGDCLVNISDLGALLPNYNGAGTYTFYQGDVYPRYFGDSVVDISDLGQMLSQYGDDCN